MTFQGHINYVDLIIENVPPFLRRSYVSGRNTRAGSSRAAR